MKLALLCTVSSLAVGLVGCAGDSRSPDRFASQFGACPDVPAFFSTACTTSGCHAASGSAAMLDLASPDLATRLAGRSATGGSGLLVDPKEPDHSVLYTKLTAAPPFGSRMPLTGKPLDDATVSCVLTWIESSAKGDSP